jgi:hypothetical protein
MISSITPSTISTVALYGSLPLVSLLVLLILLVMKETTTCARHPNLGKVSRVLNIGILPILIVFALQVVTRVPEVLR